MAWSSKHLDYPEDQHEGRLVCGDPKAQAWEWIKAYAKNLSNGDGYRDSDYGDDFYVITPDELIEAGLSHVETEDRWGGDYLSRGGLLEGRSTDPTFWDKLAILKDLDIPHEKRNNFFSCSC